MTVFSFLSEVTLSKKTVKEYLDPNAGFLRMLAQELVCIAARTENIYRLSLASLSFVLKT